MHGSTARGRCGSLPLLSSPVSPLLPLLESEELFLIFFVMASLIAISTAESVKGAGLAALEVSQSSTLRSSPQEAIRVPPLSLSVAETSIEGSWKLGHTIAATRPPWPFNMYRHYRGRMIQKVKIMENKMLRTTTNQLRQCNVCGLCLSTMIRPSPDRSANRKQLCGPRTCLQPPSPPPPPPH